MSKEMILTEIEEVTEELSELEHNQHTYFFKNEPEGRKRMAVLLLKLNELEEAETKMV